MSSLYRMARQVGFATLRTRLGRPWKVLTSHCHSDGDPCGGQLSFDFMEFGGRTVYDPYGNPSSWSCWDPFKIRGREARFAQLFSRLASLTNFCHVLVSYWNGDLVPPY